MYVIAIKQAKISSMLIKPGQTFHLSINQDSIWHNANINVSSKFKKICEHIYILLICKRKTEHVNNRQYWPTYI